MENIKLLARLHGTPLILFSEKEFRKKYQSFQEYLPNVKHHYSLKPLPTKECIDIIASCNGYIDIASMGELELVKSANPMMLKRCIFTHPIKKESEIVTAIENGITTMVVENVAEMKKFIPHAKTTRILIRLAFPNDEALCNLSEKFGATEEKFKILVAFAQKHDLNVIGCSFHVGSQMPHPEKYVSSIKKCHKLYEWALATHGFRFSVLDIGGGFPAQYKKSDMELNAFCKPIEEELNLYFPNMEIWSEPGRSVAANSMMVITQIIGKSNKNKHVWYYLDDGIYSTYSGEMFEKIDYPLHAFHHSTESPILTVFAGPTCDSVDLLDKDIMFQPLNIGDYLFSKKIGAYGWSSRTNFNLLPAPKIVAYDFDLEKVEQFIESKKL